jgi:hypothetical protein
MRILASILLAISLGAALLAQTPVGAQQPPDIEVMSFKWGVPHTTTFSQNPGYGADASTPKDDRNRKEPITEIERSAEANQYRIDPSKSGSPGGIRQRKVEQTVDRFETYLYVKNSGDKRIKAISWRYIFYTDWKYQKEVKHYTFRGKTDILPGELKTLIKPVVDRASTRYHSVLIDHIEYADGSKWQRTESK